MRRQSSTAVRLCALLTALWMLTGQAAAGAAAYSGSPEGETDSSVSREEDEADGRDYPAESSDGVEAYTLHITSPQDLADLAERVNGGDSMEFVTVELKADLDMAGHSPWTPIGSSPDTPFSGSFAGNGHVVRNLSTAGTALDSGAEEGHHADGSQTVGGLFGFLVGAKVKEVYLQNVGCPNSTDGLYGGIASTEISDCGIKWGLFGLLTRRARSRAAAVSTAGWSGRAVTDRANDAFYKAVLEEFFNVNTASPSMADWRANGPLVLNEGITKTISVKGAKVQATSEDALASLAWVTSAWDQPGQAHSNARGSLTSFFYCYVYLNGTFDLKGFDWYPIGAYGAQKAIRGQLSINEAMISGSGDNGCVIRNYYSTYGGLFGYLNDGSVLSGITMERPVIHKTKDLPYETNKANDGFPANYFQGYAGAVINVNVTGIVRRCTVLDADITAPKAGGIVGRMEYSYTTYLRSNSVSKCLVRGGTINGETLVGGIVGVLQANAASQNVVYGSELASDGLVGGITARVESPGSPGAFGGISESLVGNITFNVTLPGPATRVGGLAADIGVDGKDSSAGGAGAASFSNNMVVHCTVSTPRVNPEDWAGIVTAAGDDQERGVRGLLTDAPQDEFLVFPASHGPGIHSTMSKIYWDRTTAPIRGDHHGAPGIQSNQTTFALTSGGFSGLESSVWTFRQDAYPRINSLVNSANPLAAHIASIAAVPVLMSEEDLDGTWEGTRGVRLPLTAPDGDALIWTGQVRAAGRTMAFNTASMAADPNWKEISADDTQLDIAAKFGSAAAAKTAVYRYIDSDRDGANDYLLLYNLSDGNAVLTNLEARTAGRTDVSKRFYSSIILEDAMLWEDKDGCYPSRDPSNPSSVTSDELKAAEITLSFEEELALTPPAGAGSITLYESLGADGSGNHRWASIGTLDCADPANVTITDRKIVFKLFGDATGLLPEDGKLYRIAIPAGVAQERGKENYNEAATLYVQTQDSRKSIITKLKDRQIRVHGEAALVDNMLTWLHVLYGGVTYGAASGCDAHPAGTPACTLLAADHIFPLPGDAWSSLGYRRQDIAFNRSALEKIEQEIAKPGAVSTPRPADNMPNVFYLTSGPNGEDSLTPGGALPSPGTYAITIFAYSSNGQVASESFTLYVEGARVWGDVRQPDPDTPTNLPHLHMGLTGDKALVEQTLASQFQVVYDASTGDQAEGRVRVEIVESDWQDLVATGRPQQLHAKVWALKRDGTPREGTDPAYAPVTVELCMDMLEIPNISSNRIRTTVPSSEADIEAMIAATFHSPYPATFDHMGNSYDAEGTYFVTVRFDAADSTLCPVPQIDGHLLFKGDFQVKYQVDLTAPKETINRDTGGQELDFWEQVAYDARHREMSHLVVRADFPRTMPLWVMTDLRDFSPYNEVALTRQDYRWRLFGHTAEPGLRHDSGLTMYLQVTEDKSFDCARYTGGRPAVALEFDQVGDLYAAAGFDYYLGEREAGERWYLYAVDEGRGRLRYVSDALVDEGWACSILERLYHAPYLLTTLPPSSPNVIQGWENGLPLGLHYGRSQLRTDPGEDVFLAANPFALTQGDPGELTYHIEPDLPPESGEEPQEAPMGGTALAMALVACPIAVAAVLALYGKKRKQEEGQTDET